MKNVKLIAILAMIGLSALSVFHMYDVRSSKVNTYDKYLAQARTAAENGIYVDAENYYKQAIKVKDSVEAEVELGEMYIESEQPTKAKKLVSVLEKNFQDERQTFEYKIKFYKMVERYGSCFATYNEMLGRGVESEYVEKEMAEIKYSYFFNGRYDEVKNFSGTRYAVRNKEKWGYASLKGNRAIETQYQYAGPFNGEVAPVIDQEGKAYFVDVQGNMKLGIKKLKKVKELGYLSGEIFPAFDGKKWQFYNLDCEPLFKEYDEVSSFGNGYAAVCKTGFWSIIDQTGATVIDKKYDDVKQDDKGIVYRNDRMFVKINDYYYLVDGTGNKVVNTKFKNAAMFNSTGYAAVNIDGKWGFIDIDGNVVIKPKYKNARSFSNGLAAVETAKGWGFISEDGEMAIEPQFDDALDFNEKGVAFVIQNGKWQGLTLYSKNYE